MKKFISICFLALASVAANAASIDFNDGISGTVITNQYAAMGVTFSNARYDGFVSPGEAGVGNSGLKLVGNGEGGAGIYNPSAANPIVLTFSKAISDFSIRGLNVGNNGARVEAFDSMLGGSLVDFDQAAGSGAGVSNHPLLTVSGASIFRITLFNPFTVSGEGMLWDNVEFTPASVQAVPVPAAIFMLAPALIGFLGLRRKSKSLTA